VLLLALTAALSVAQAEHAHPAPVSAVALELAQRPVPMRTGIATGGWVRGGLVPIDPHVR